MTGFSTLIRTAAIAAVVVGIAVPSGAQESGDTTGQGSDQETTQVSPEHLAAARAAIDALNATDQFDAILPNAAEALKHSLIQATPNLQTEITETVDEQAIDMAGRRGALEREAAGIYAKEFSQDELEAIADFFNSDTGKKLIAQKPKADNEINKAARIWANGIARDLATQSKTALSDKLGKAPDAADGGASNAQ